MKFRFLFHKKFLSRKYFLRNHFSLGSSFVYLVVMLNSYCRRVITVLTIKHKKWINFMIYRSLVVTNEWMKIFMIYLFNVLFYAWVKKTFINRQVSILIDLALLEVSLNIKRPSALLLTTRDKSRSNKLSAFYPLGNRFPYTKWTRPAWAGFKTVEEGRANTPFGVGEPCGPGVEVNPQK
jgi:hypothetical protein